MNQKNGENIRILYLEEDKERSKTTKKILEAIEPSLDLFSVISIENELDTILDSYDCILSGYDLSSEQWNEIDAKNGSISVPVILFTSIMETEQPPQTDSSVNLLEAVDQRLNEYQVLAQHIQDTVAKNRERLSMLDSERKLRSILENMLEGCQVIDFDYRYVYLNSVAIRHARKTQEELIGKTIMACYPGVEGTDMYRNLTRCLRERVHLTMENFFSYPNGTEAWFELRFEPVPAGVFILSIDISARKEAEQRLLETERLRIAETIRADQAEDIERVMTQFIRNATHEIRTPLTSMIGYLDLVQSEITEPGPEVELYLDVLQRNTMRLEKLTSDLLDIQRLTNERIILDKSDISVMSLIDLVKTEVDPLLVEKSQTLVVSGRDAFVYVDHTRVMQVLVNLVMNASRFSPVGSEIRLVVEPTKDTVLVSVFDTGVGLSVEDISKLFTPFPDIHVEGVKDGTGLGLSICKGIVELHGGKIWAESEGRGKGSVFIFTIPVHSP